MKARIKLTGLLAVLALAVLALPAVAHTGHTAINLTCADPSPSATNAHGTSSCTFTFAFGSTDTNKTDKFELQLPVDAKLNEDGAADGADPSDGEKIGQTTVSTDLAYDGCGDANDGGTYSTYWEDTWRAYTAPAGWTKVAEYNTVFTVLFFFTENVPSHVIKNNTTGQYAVVTDIPQDRGCAGATTTFNPLQTYGYAQNNSSQEWVGKNPSTTGNKTVKIIATEVGGTVHDDTDTITIS